MYKVRAMCSRLATDSEFRDQIVLAPQDWKQASTLTIMGESPGIARQGHETKEDTVVKLIFSVTWTQEKDPDCGLDPSEIAKKKQNVFEQKRLERQQEALEREECAETRAPEEVGLDGPAESLDEDGAAAEPLRLQTEAAGTS